MYKKDILIGVLIAGEKVGVEVLKAIRQSRVPVISC
jgi:hypothetical protein